jgi:hypothetical protein
VEFLGPYFGDRVAHVRWSAVKRAEWRKQWAGGSLLADSGAQCGAGGAQGEGEPAAGAAAGTEPEGGAG